MNDAERQQLLDKAQENLRRLGQERGWGSVEVRSATEDLSDLQRRTAAEMDLPYAVPVDLGVAWDIGAPVPVLMSGQRTFVSFYCPAPDPSFDGTNPKMRDSTTDQGVGVVEFKYVTSVKIGSPNDEVLTGHPLWESGLEFYRAHLVENSPWIQQLMEINRVHSGFNEARWTDCRHYVLTFHDETLECVARDALAWREHGTMREVVARLTSQTVG